MKFQISVLLNFVVLILLVGCKAREIASDVKLAGGSLVPTDQTYPATVRINESCTAARIGPASFLLAAHCFYRSPERPVYNMIAGGKMNIGKGVQAATHFKMFEIEAVFLHPLYLEQMRQSREILPELYQQLEKDPDNVELQEKVFDHDTNVPGPKIPDVALLTVKMDSEKEAFLESVSMARISTKTLNPAMQNLLIGGFGCTDANARDGGVLHAAELSKGEYRLESSYFVKVKNSVQGCEGDSGGPVYLKEPVPLTVVGVNSYVSDQADAWTAFTRLDAQSPGSPAAFLRGILPTTAFTSGGPGR